MTIANLFRASRIALVLTLTICTINASQSQSRESYAVLDLEGRGISANEANSLTDRLRSFLVQTNAVTVVERGQMQQILQEQDFQLSGCTSNECAVEVGQLLGVTKMVSGTIGQFGGTYTIDLKIVDVESGAIERSVIRDYKGELDGLLSEMNQVAHELVGLEGPPASQATLTPQKRGISFGAAAVIAIVLGGAGYYALNELGRLNPTDTGNTILPPSIGSPPSAPGTP